MTVAIGGIITRYCKSMGMTCQGSLGESGWGTGKSTADTTTGAESPWIVMVNYAFRQTADFNVIDMDEFRVGGADPTHLS